MQGDSGLFYPMKKSFLNCEDDRSLCEDFQEGRKDMPCDEKNKFRCFFKHKYVDGAEARGSVIKADVRFELSDAARVEDTPMAFG